MKPVTLTVLLASCLFLSAALQCSDASAEDSPGPSCQPRVLSAPSEFPLEAQKRAQHGIVQLLVTLDASGHALSAVTRRSSGSASLDRAAHRSVLTVWQFDTTGCAAKAFPVTKLVEIEYRLSPAPTLAGTQLPSRGRVLAGARANPACFTRFGSTVHNEDFSIACIDKRAPTPPSLAQGDMRPRL